MLNQASIDERIAKCEKIIDENPSSQIFAALADARRKKGELDKAFRICQQGLRLHPDYGAGHLIMARINYDRKMYDWAETELNKAIELDGRTRATDLLQVEIWVRQGKFLKAKSLIDELAQSDPYNDYFAALQEKIKLGLQEKKKREIENKRLLNSQMDSDENEASETKEQKKEEPLDLSGALELLSEFPGVVACFVTDTDGMMIDSKLPDMFDKASYAAFSAEIYRFINENVDRIKFGRTKKVLVERGREKVWLIDHQEKLLVLVLLPKTNLGSLKLKIKNVIERLVSL